MNTDKKYYTPEFEDFAIGLEWEEYSQGRWQKLEIYGSIDELEDWGLAKERKRVKFLDKEDIESLGWEYEKDDFAVRRGMLLDFTPNILFKKPNFKLFFYPERQAIGIWIADVTKLEYCEKFGVWFQVDQFPIKNKYELAQLMKKLKIE